MFKSLFLTAWYPNRNDKMFGLFVKKHALAVGRYCDVWVLYIHSDKNIRKTELSLQITENIHEIIIYYPEYNSPFFRRFIKLISYLNSLIKGLRIYFKHSGLPDIVHVNVLTRTGIPALLLKFFKKTPYVITEHWTRYLPENNSYKGFLRKMLTKIIVKHASVVMPVSKQLEFAMKAHGLLNNEYHIINNVVDPFFFQSEHKILKGNTKRILLVSCFLERAKNVKGLLRSIKSLSLKRTDFQLTIVGDGPDFQEIYEYCKGLNFSENLINFTGEKRPEEVANYYAEADFFILFSNYETAGIVIAESLASGIPIISTKVGIAPDFITKESGLLVDTGDEVSFETAINQMLDHINEYDYKTIRESGKIFTFEETGKMIFNLYRKIL